MFLDHDAAYREEMDLPLRLSTSYIPGVWLVSGSWAQTVKE